MARTSASVLRPCTAARTRRARGSSSGRLRTVSIAIIQNLHLPSMTAFYYDAFTHASVTPSASDGRKARKFSRPVTGALRRSSSLRRPRFGPSQGDDDVADQGIRLPAADSRHREGDGRRRDGERSEERREGKEGVSTCRSWW